MKKIISLALAIIMIMMIGVVAFADHKHIDVIRLHEPEKDETELIEIDEYEFDEDDTGDDRVFYTDAEGGTYYLILAEKDVKELKNLKVQVDNNFVDASFVDFDATKMTFNGIHYGMKYKDGEIVDLETSDYDEAVDKAKEESKEKRVTYKIVAVVEVEEELFEVKPTLVKLVVEKNYGTTYKEATVKVTATRKEDGKNVKLESEFKVVSDVIFFHKDEVEASVDRFALTVGDEGYSDYTEDDDTPATVISKTAFKAVVGETVEVENGNNDILDWTVNIDKVASGQPGVNFMPAEIKFIDKAGKDWTDTSKEKLEVIKFGFPAKQTIASEFEIEFNFDFTYGDLLKAFKGKLEEKDVVDYFIYKDGKVLDKLTVDYADRDVWDDKVEFIVKCKADETLGVYELKAVGVYEAEEIKETETEENPNTGAPALPIVGAIACLALTAGIAVSCKKY